MLNTTGLGLIVPVVGLQTSSVTEPVGIHVRVSGQAFVAAERGLRGKDQGVIRRHIGNRLS